MFKSLKNVLAKFKKKTIEITKHFEDKKINSLLDEFEEELITNNISYVVVEKIIEDVRTLMKEGKTNKENITKKLKEIFSEILSAEKIDLIAESNSKKPLVILFVGVNGVGKTTCIAKIGKMFLDAKKTVVMAAGDTFRAAAIEQLESHANKLKIKLIKQDYGSDPAAVAFDAKKHAESRGIDVVLIDTAGRQHASEDLMNELQKIKRVISPDITLLVVDALTGNDASEQAKYFNEKIEIDGIIISKTDADEKGGAIISAAYEIKKPILFLGIGQKYSDLEVFEKDKIISKILD